MDKPNFQWIDVKKLTLLEKNPRRITSDQMDKLCKSIQKDPDFLLNRPILVNKVNEVYTVYAGNQRVQAAKKLKMKKIPCIIDENLSEDILKSRILKDNKTYGEFDYDILANEYDLEHLFDAGFSHLELGLEHAAELIDTPDEDQEKEDVLKTCPHCGKEI